MRVILAVPPFSASPSRKAARIKRGKLRPHPPLGLGYLAAVLEAHGHEVALVDAQARELSVPQAVDAILAHSPDVVGISSFTVFADVTTALAKALRSRAPHLWLVVGGPHATAFHEALLEECPEADFVIPGEAEHVLAELVDRLAAKRSYEDVAGIVFRDTSGVVVSTPPAPCLENLDDLPDPARHIYADHEYVPLPNQSRRRPVTTMMTSRGCPWARCRFCYQGGKYASAFRRRSPEHVIAELARIVREDGIREVIFWDDNFCINAQWIRRFCDLMDQARLDLTWTVQGRVNTVTREMLMRMAASGCYNIFLGFESGSQTLLEVIDKGITLDQSRRAVEWANEAGLEIRGAFMLGLPCETPALAEETIRFACELDVDYMVFMPYHIQRGTALEEIALREGRVVHIQGEAFDWNTPTYVPKGYASAEELAAMVRRAYRQFYLRPRYIRRALRRARDPVVLRNYLIAFGHWLSLIRRRGARP